MPRIDIPEPGYYMRKLVRGGPWVPCRIWLDDSISDRPPILLAECNGKEVWADELWTWCCGHAITESEYRMMVADRDWCAVHAPGDPILTPTKRIDLKTLDPASLF